MARRILRLLPCLLAAIASPAFAACPLNHFSFSGTPFSALPVDSRSGVNQSAKYNVPQGTLQATAGCFGECGSSAGVYVEDDFTLSGLPDGTPVPLVAHFLLGNLFQNAGASASANIQDLTHSTSASVGGPRTNYDLTLAISAVAGQPFRMHFEVACGGFGASSLADGTFSFTGVPAGAVLTSCQGYTLGGAVPAEATSWGSVKSIYR